MDPINKALLIFALVLVIVPSALAIVVAVIMTAAKEAVDNKDAKKTG